MAKMDDIIQAEYKMTTEIWRWEKRWLEKIPLSFDDFKAMNDEANALAKSRKGKSQELLVRILNGYADEIAFIDRRIRETENDKK